MNKTLGVIIVVLIIAGGGYYYWQKRQQNPAVGDYTKIIEAGQEEPAEETPPPVLPPQGGGMDEKEEGNEPSVQEISLTTGGFFYTPNVLTLKKGRPVRITITSQGHHNFTIDELGVSKDMPAGTHVVEFIPETEGIFIYYCSLPGHRAQGQFGTVTVEE